MKRRKSLFIHLSNIRLLAKKFAVVLLFLSAFVMMLVNKTDTILIEKTSSVATDVVSPIIDFIVIPAKAIVSVYDYFKEIGNAREENERLIAENNELRLQYNKARSMEVENKLLSKLLNYIPPKDATYITARVIAEEDDAFSHSLIAYTGLGSSVKKGQVAVSDKGVVGRVESVGQIYSKILLISDINSRIPVIIEKTRVRGVLAGDNTQNPQLIFIPLEAELSIGDRIVTSGVAGVFPAGLLVGKIVGIEKNNVRVKPVAPLEQLEYLKIIDYGLEGIIGE